MDLTGAKGAAEELHRAVDGAIPEAQRAADEIVSRVASEIVNVAAGAIERAAGAVCLSLGALPEQIVDALDGLTVEISPVRITVSRMRMVRTK